MRIDEIVRVNDQNILIDTIRSDIAQSIMHLYLRERRLSDDFKIAASEMYPRDDLADMVYDVSLMQTKIKTELKASSQTRRALSELQKWYNGTLEEELAALRESIAILQKMLADSKAAAVRRNANL